MKDISCIISDFLLPSIPIIEDFLEVAKVGGPITDSIKENIDRLCEIKESNVGKTFRTIASQILDGIASTPEVEKLNLECLRSVLKSQETINRIRKITFYVIAASGAIGIIEPITGGISLIASITVPMIMSNRQKKLWRKIDTDLPGINYLYEVSKDINKEFVMSTASKIEDTFHR